MIGPETRLEDIDFPARARHALRREGVETVGTLLSVDRDWLGALKGVGKKAMQFVRDLEDATYLGPPAHAGQTARIAYADDVEGASPPSGLHGGQLASIIHGGDIRLIEDTRQDQARNELRSAAMEILGFTCRNRIPDVNSARESVRIAAAMRDEAARLAGTAASLDVNRVVDFQGASYLVLPYRKNDDYPPEAVHLVLVPQVDP